MSPTPSRFVSSKDVRTMVPRTTPLPSMSLAAGDVVHMAVKGARKPFTGGASPCTCSTSALWNSRSSCSYSTSWNRHSRDACAT